MYSPHTNVQSSGPPLVTYSSPSKELSYTNTSSSPSSSEETLVVEQLNRPWLDQEAVFIPTQQRKLPKNLEHWIPKFNPDEISRDEDHIKNFMEFIRLRKT